MSTAAVHTIVASAAMRDHCADGLTPGAFGSREACHAPGIGAGPARSGMAERKPTTGRRTPRRSPTERIAARRLARTAPAAAGVPVDFTAAYVRRALEPRLRGHGELEVHRVNARDVTIVHRYRSEWNGRDVMLAIARLRYRSNQVELYWKNTNGRWMRYQTPSGLPFAGSLEACLKAIADDRWGCFWG